MRAIAILLVLVAHAPLGAAKGSAIYKLSAQGGLLGVDLFFALSGFLIGGILLDTGERLREGRILGGFWISRWLRTLPNFYLLFVVNLVLGTVIFTRRHTEWTEFASTALFLQNITHAPGWFYGEAWTLSIEEWFYVLLPLGLWLGLRAGIGFRVVFAVMLTALFGGPLLHRASVGEAWTMDLSMAVLNRLDALACGVAAAWIARRRPEAWRRSGWAPAAVGLGLIASETVVLMAWPDTMRQRAVHAVLPVLQPLGAALLLPVFCRVHLQRAPALGAAIAATARWSYSLYLVNSSLAFVIHRLWAERVGASVPLRLAADALYLAACFLAAMALYRFYERPFLRMRERIALCREAAAAKAAGAARLPG